MTKSVIVIGAGHAGCATVAKLRKLGYPGKITLIGNEPFAPYQRPPLSKAFLLGKVDQEQLLLKPADFYTDNDIELVTDRRVTTIDRAAKTIRTEDGGRHSYDDLVIATGANPIKIPDSAGGALTGIHYMRHQLDALNLRADLASRAHILIVGGGYIGLEAAAVARTLGLEVTLVEAGERILQRVASVETSNYFRSLHQQNGVIIREGVGLSRFAGADRVNGAELDDGSELSIDLAIVGIGVRPAVEIAQDAGLETGNGILVNQFGQTNDVSIWAVGDCCAFPFQGQQIRLESVPHAQAHGEAVAQNIAGERSEYAASPWFWSDQYDVKLQIAGLNTGYDAVVTRQLPDAAGQSHWYFKNNRLIAVDAMNDPRSYLVAKKMLGSSVLPTTAQIADPTTDLKALLKG